MPAKNTEQGLIVLMYKGEDMIQPRSQRQTRKNRIMRHRVVLFLWWSCVVLRLEANINSGHKNNQIKDSIAFCQAVVPRTNCPWDPSCSPKFSHQTLVWDLRASISDNDMFPLCEWIIASYSNATSSYRHQHTLHFKRHISKKAFVNHGSISPHCMLGQTSFLL